MNETTYKVGNCVELGLYRLSGGSADWAFVPSQGDEGDKYALIIEKMPTLNDVCQFVFLKEHRALCVQPPTQRSLILSAPWHHHDSFNK